MVVDAAGRSHRARVDNDLSRTCQFSASVAADGWRTIIFIFNETLLFEGANGS